MKISVNVKFWKDLQAFVMNKDFCDFNKHRLCNEVQIYFSKDKSKTPFKFFHTWNQILTQNIKMNAVRI